MRILYLASAALVGASLIVSFAPATAQAVKPRREGDSGFNSPITAATGEETYRTICQACHMADAKGATGAGTFPALSGNPKLAAGAYLAMIVLRGKGAMPAFRPYLTDVQIAEVTNYVRTHFGNKFSGEVTAGDVAKLNAIAPKR